MSISQFIPSIWSGSILARLNDESAFIPVANRKYEGEVRGQGDKVKINELGPVTIRSYTRNSTGDITWEYLTDAQQELSIDQAKYFAFAVDDLDRAQSKPDVMAEAIKNATWGLRDDIDASLAGTYAQAGINYSLTVNSNNLFKALEGISSQLDQRNCPLSGRWMVCPPWFEKKLVASKITKDQGNPALLANGAYRGKYFGFDVFVSNNITNGNLSTTPSASNSKVMLGGPEALALVVQVSKVEAVRPDKQFIDLVKGLLLYGYKVTRPGNLACLTATWVAESTA